MDPKHQKYISYGIIAFFALLLAWYLNILIYAILFAAPVIIIRFKAPSLGWKRPVGLGLFLCFFWFLVNVIAFLTLAPVMELGFNKAISEATGDLLRHPHLISDAMVYTLYRTRLAVVIVATGALIFALIHTPTGRGLGLHRLFELPGGFDLSQKTTVGSARWAAEKELRNYFTAKGPGVILGKNTENEPYILPVENEKFDYQRNQNIVVFGATGSGKTVSFVKPNVLQADASLVITDPKREIYDELGPYLKAQGYNVYCFNLLDMRNSHRWNPLVKKDGTCELSVQDAVLMASSIIKNTKDPAEKTSDPFWEKSEQALLTSLIVYAANHFQTSEEKNFANILRFATGRTSSALDYDFGRLPPTDPSKAAFQVYQQAPEKVRGSIIISLGTRLQLFQDDALAELTSASEFDFTELGEEKTAIFVILSDYDETYNSISALFFTQAFQELYKLASRHNGTLPQFTRFTMDEFCNIGFIPGYTVKLSTMRSRGISSQMIIQSLGQLENRYPFGFHNEIIGNCDLRLMMGANDFESAKYFTELIGRSTVQQETRGRSDRVLIDAGHKAQREFPRELISPDEILRMDNKEALLLVRGGFPAKIQKMHYQEHPEAAALDQESPLPLMKEHKVAPPGEVENELISEIEKQFRETPDVPPEDLEGADDAPVPDDVNP